MIEEARAEAERLLAEWAERKGVSKPGVKFIYPREIPKYGARLWRLSMHPAMYDPFFLSVFVRRDWVERFWGEPGFDRVFRHALAHEFAHHVQASRLGIGGMLVLLPEFRPLLEREAWEMAEELSGVSLPEVERIVKERGYGVWSARQATSFGL